jgi:t-SNARE complex subunit (syntaxin)
MVFKDLGDIENDKRLREKEKMKDEISQDIEDVIDNFRRKVNKSREERKKKRGLFGKIIIILLLIFAFLCVIDLLLGSVWLLKFFIKSLFNLK